MTIAVDSDIKHQHKQTNKNLGCFFTKNMKIGPEQAMTVRT